MVNKRLVQQIYQLSKTESGYIPYNPDSEWQVLWSASNGDQVIYRKRNGIVNILGDSFGSLSVNAKTNSLLGVLPVGYRPAREVVTLGTPKDYTGYPFQINIQVDGSVFITNLHPNNARSYWGFNITYLV